jgi:hypothetical protein
MRKTWRARLALVAALAALVAGFTAEAASGQARAGKGRCKEKRGDGCDCQAFVGSRLLCGDGTRGGCGHPDYLHE